MAVGGGAEFSDGAGGPEIGVGGSANVYMQDRSRPWDSIRNSIEMRGTYVAGRESGYNGQKRAQACGEARDQGVKHHAQRSDAIQ
jgi:hypothetical protein